MTLNAVLFGHGSQEAAWRAPPPDPNDGDRFLVASSATGNWTGWDNSIA
ncbi:DUF2793 domain-containing protein [Roseovarius amoyensis]|nr:DUF2793 domain-containing protein [Roseovarius amoyensis]